MSNTTTRYKNDRSGKRIVRGWQLEAILGRKETFFFSAKTYSKGDVKQYAGALDELERAYKRDRTPEPELLETIQNMPGLLEKLKEKGLFEYSVCLSLKELCERFIKDNEVQGLAPSTIQSRKNAARRLRDFFGDDRKAEDITKSEAKEYDAEMARLVKTKENGGQGIAPATRSGVIKNTKAIFNWGVKMELIASNPFQCVTAGSQANRKRQYYLTLNETALILKACEYTNNGDEWAVMCALARYQGLRVPSESRALRWSDVDFKNQMIHITAQKTKSERDMPLFKNTMSILKRLQENQERAGTFNDSPFVLRTVRMVTNPGTTFKKIVQRAGVEDYPKPFQNLRASAATDVYNMYGTMAESRWIGHGAAIAEGHYLMVAPGTLERAKREGITDQAPKVQAPQVDVNPFDTTPDSWKEETR